MSDETNDIQEEAQEEIVSEETSPETNNNSTNDQVAQLEDQLKRTAADFANFRKRTDEERKQLIPVIQAQVLLDLTPVLDNFRRATEHLPEHLQKDNWVTGVLYIEKQLEQIFEQFGITKIKTMGEEFNHEFHEAIGQESHESIEANHIISEVEGGYLMNGKVLKPAKVKVSSGK